MCCILYSLWKRYSDALVTFTGSITKSYSLCQNMKRTKSIKMTLFLSSEIIFFYTISPQKRGTVVFPWLSIPRFFDLWLQIWKWTLMVAFPDDTTHFVVLLFNTTLVLLYFVILRFDIEMIEKIHCSPSPPQSIFKIPYLTKNLGYLQLNIGSSFASNRKKNFSREIKIKC